MDANGQPSKTKEVTTPHNNLFVSVFGQAEQAREFFQSYLPREILPLLDMSRLKRKPETFIDPVLKDRQVDLLYELPLKGEKESKAYAYMLFEHQSTYDSLQSLRLLGYMARIWEWWLKDHPNAKRLPIILPIVLYHGQQPWKASLEFFDHIDIEAEHREKFRAFLPNFRFLLTDLTHIPDEGILGSPACKLTLHAFKWAKNPDLENKFRTWQRLFEGVIATPVQGWLFLEVVLRYLAEEGEGLGPKTMVEILSKVDRKAGEIAMTIKEQLIQEGIRIGEQKGIAIGKAEGKAVSLLTIIQLKFGPLSDEIKERIEAAPEADLDTWLQRVLFVGTLDELFLDKRRFS